MNVPKQYTTPHPGEILLNEYIESTGLSCNKLARLLNVPQNRISEIVAGRRTITADTAIRLGKFFDTGADLWLGLQGSYELSLAHEQHAEEYAKITVFTPQED